MNLRRLSSRTAAVFGAAVALLVIAPTTAVAEYPSLSEPPAVDYDGQQDAALIIAVEDYLLLPDVEGAAEAGREWQAYFESALGIPDVHFIRDSNARLEQIERFARATAQDVGDDGRIWVVFIGHGSTASDGEDGLLVGTDAPGDAEDLRKRSISQQRLLDILNDAHHRETVMFVDACYSGRDTEGEQLYDAYTAVVPSEKLEPEDDVPTTVLSAAAADEFAGPLPGEDRPAFSYLALGALHGWADEGELTARDLIDFTRRRLLIPGRFQQTPEIYGDEHLVLPAATRQTDPGIDELMDEMHRHEQDVPRQEDPADIDPDQVDCPEGKEATEETRGNCCWPGQVWSRDRQRCVGTPEECPPGKVVDDTGEDCAPPPCEEGKVRMDDGVNCCWPGQVWSSGREKCVGVPEECPSGYEVVGENCERRHADWVEVSPGTTYPMPQTDDWSQRSYPPRERVGRPDSHSVRARDRRAMARDIGHGAIGHAL